jgi:diacylglycerol kinase family enzyme
MLGPTGVRAMSARKRQWAAVAAILVGVGAVVAAGALFWNHWWALLVLVGCLVVATWSAWYVISRRGLARWVGALVMVAALTGALVALVRDHAGWKVVLVLALGLAASCLARVALGSGQNQLRAQAPPGVRMGPARHPVLLFNPKSGGGKANAAFLAEAHARHIETVGLTAGDDLRELAEAAVAGGADVIGMAGGDGSQALVAAIAAAHHIPYVCVPAGTRNHFALDLGVDRDDVIGALDAFVDGYERPVDLAFVNGRVFVNNVSLGLYASIVQSQDYRDAKMGTAAKMLPDLLGGDYSQFDFHLDGPGEVDRIHPDLIQVSNNVYTLSGIGGFGARARLDEGVLGIVAIEVRDASDLTRLMALEAAGRGSSFAGWHQWSDTRLVIRSAKPIYSGIDGEAVTLDSPLVFEIQRGALRVRIAPHHPGVSPAAIAGAVHGGGPRRLLQVALGRHPANEPGQVSDGSVQKTPVGV